MSRAILSTRPDGPADPLVGRLAGLGYRVHAVPTVATEAVEFAVPDLSRHDWVVVTSGTGVRHLLDRLPDAAGARWAAVGPRTVGALRERGINADATPRLARGALIAEAIAARQPLPGLRILLARADAAAGDLPAALVAGGALVEELVVYRTVFGPEASREPLRGALDDPELAGVVFASGSAVRGLLRLAARDPRRLPAVSIGPMTTEVARAEGFGNLVEAESATVDGLVNAVLAHVA